jgi:hypothetical protein
MQFAPYYQSFRLDVLPPPDPATNFALILESVEPVTKLDELDGAIPTSSGLSCLESGILFTSESFDLGAPLMARLNPATAAFFGSPSTGGLTRGDTGGGLTGGSLSGGGSSNPGGIPPKGTGMFAGAQALGGIYYAPMNSSHDLVVSFPLPGTTQGGPYLYSAVDPATFEILASGPAVGDQQLGVATNGKGFMLLLYSATAVEHKLALTDGFEPDCPAAAEYDGLPAFASGNPADCVPDGSSCVERKAMLFSAVPFGIPIVPCTSNGAGDWEPVKPDALRHKWSFKSSITTGSKLTEHDVDIEVGAEIGTGELASLFVEVTGKANGRFDGDDHEQSISGSNSTTNSWTLPWGRVPTLHWIEKKCCYHCDFDMGPHGLISMSYCMEAVGRGWISAADCEEFSIAELGSEGSSYPCN